MFNDVRELNEWQVAHIPGALHIPKDKLHPTSNLKYLIKTPHLSALPWWRQISICCTVSYGYWV